MESKTEVEEDYDIFIKITLLPAQMPHLSQMPHPPQG
jgi:hypothetical protein